MELPSEIVVQILGYLAPPDLARYCLTKHNLRASFGEQLYRLLDRIFSNMRERLGTIIICYGLRGIDDLGETIKLNQSDNTN